MTSTATPVNNGVNVDALLGARTALTEAPEAAKFQWRATCEWQNGTHSTSTVEGFFGLGEEQQHRTSYSFDVDHPEIFASEDNGATPVEYVLVGLAGCLTAGVAAVAQNRGDPAAQGGRDDRGRDGRARHPRHGQRRPQRLQLDQGHATTSTPMRRPTRSRRSLRSRRSGPRCTTSSRTRPTCASRSSDRSVAAGHGRARCAQRR